MEKVQPEIRKDEPLTILRFCDKWPACAPQKTNMKAKNTDPAISLAAATLARMGKGVPRTHSPEHLAVLTQRLEKARLKRWPHKQPSQPKSSTAELSTAETDEDTM